MSINDGSLSAPTADNPNPPVKKSMFDKIKALDLYRKLPSDMVQPTYSGAMSNKNI